MRRRIEAKRTPPGQDAQAIKTGAGGLIDAEFIAQTLWSGQRLCGANTLRALQRRGNPRARTGGRRPADRELSPAPAASRGFCGAELLKRNGAARRSKPFYGSPSVARFATAEAFATHRGIPPRHPVRFTNRLFPPAHCRAAVRLCYGALKAQRLGDPSDSITKGRSEPQRRRGSRSTAT